MENRVTKELESRFHQKMIEVYELAKKECNYPANRFLQMVGELGGLAAAKQLLASSRHPEGLTRLWEAGRLDISMEALVLGEPWCSLFSPVELAIARKRLASLGYPVT
jgi:hypothetical protein